MGKGFDKFLNMIRLNDEEYDDYDDYEDYEDDYEDDFDDIPAPVVKKKTFKKEKAETVKETKSPIKKAAKPEPVFRSAPAASANRGKIVPMKSTASRGEVCVLRPTAFEDSREISDVLLSGRAAVVNLEGIDLEIAQRIIDFISGSCYAMAGNIEKISNYIFIVTPESIEISGDIQEVISSGIHIPAFHDNF
ncbi:MAG: cell division protein SepF [Clostridia bacterium]|nr:cell division protein SepF [Lachnospiraceae bacterium]NCC00637.1 cell division protein SepF [Clostridia bacterium]NCD02649.1 cell division protein SepF [Clostridia bacterium]